MGMLFLITSTIFSQPTAKVTARFIDEEGHPIEGAKASCGFESPKKTGLGVINKRVKGLTDVNGLFTAKSSNNAYGVGCSAKKEGYYRGNGGTGRHTGISGIYGFRKWQPWNPIIEIVLKKIKNPIPMYVAEMQGRPTYDNDPAMLPEEGKFFGFDLIAKDWVVPHGQGLHSDFIFKIDVKYFTRDPLEYDSTMTLKFTNPDDGIQPFYTPKNRGSDLRSAHYAPLTGYQDKLITRRFRKSGEILKSPFRDDQNYYFRIRTKRDDQGNIIEAHYGKIYGNISYSTPTSDEKGEIYFSYYLNPNNNDINVENAPEKNLFPKPKGHTGWYRFKP